MRAAIYCRISQDQTGEAAGATRQLEDCKALIDSHEWTLAREAYIDNDISATTGKTRPEYEQLLRDIRGNLVDAVVAWHPDRLYRKLSDLEGLLDAVERRDVIMRTVRAGELDLSTPTGRMLARILSSVATAEGEMKSDRWRRSVRQRREAGQMPGSGPRMLGWTRDGQIVEDEADDIRWLAAQIVGGSSLNALAKAAEQRGIRSTLGNVMPKASVRRLLLNPRLAGHSVLKGEIVGRGTWPTILDDETWETVRAILTSSPSRPTPPRVSTLVGLIYCGGCDKAMVTGSRVTKRHTLSRTYRCTRDAGKGGCQKVSMAAEPVEEVVEAYARERLNHPATREHLASLRRVPRIELAELTALQERLIELERQLDEPGVPVEAIVRAMDRTKARVEELSASVNAIPRVPLPEEDADWPADVATRRALVALVVERVTIAPNPGGGRLDLERIDVLPKI